MDRCPREDDVNVTTLVGEEIRERDEIYNLNYIGALVDHFFPPLLCLLRGGVNGLPDSIPP